MTLRLVIAGALCLAAILTAWVAAGRVLTSLLDRIGTVRESSLPIGDFGIDADELLIGRHRWWLGKTLRIAPDAQKRLTVSQMGRTFTLGPVTRCDAASDPHYELAPAIRIVRSPIEKADERADHPGAGLSFEVSVDRTTGRVEKEVGGQ